MIGEEMTTEVRVTVVVPAEPRLVINANGVTCPRCGLGAFEPMSKEVDGKNVPGILCLACAQQIAAWYPLPDGLKLATNRYRCSSCGVQRQVTMKLSDLNLQCGPPGPCQRLTLHSIQFETTASFSQFAKEAEFSQFAKEADDQARQRMLAVRGAVEEARRRPADVEQTALNDGLAWLSTQPAMLAVRDAAVEELLRPAAEIKRLTRDDSFVGQRSEVERLFATNLDGEGGASWPSIVGSKLPDDSRAHPQLTRAINGLRILLKLEDFETFARRNENLNLNQRNLRLEDASRRTGRTWRGLVEALARCGIERTQLLCVASASRYFDKEMCNLVLKFRSDLGMSYPKEIRSMRDEALDMARKMRKFEVPPNVILYVDHSYYERIREGWQGGI